MKAKSGYHRRRETNLRKKEALKPQISVFERSVAPLLKISGQIQDPFAESGFGFDKTIKPPYSLTTLLDFFEDNTWNNRCIKLKANLVCGQYDIISEDENQKEDTEYKILKEFIDKPNEDGEDFLDIVNKFWVDIEAMGNGYYEIVRNGLGRLSEVYHAPAHTMRKASEGKGFWHIRLGLAKKAVYFNKYGHKDKPGNEVIQHKNYFPASKYYGMPDYVPALGAMALDRNATIFNNNFFTNGGMMGMILFLKGIELNPEARQELKNMVQGNYTGVDNAHRMAIIDGLDTDADWKIEKVMESIRDMSFSVLKKADRDEILASHSVPHKLIHVAEAGKLGESKDGYNQMKFFKIFEIDPSQRRHENIWNKLFRDELGVTKWKIKFKELDIRDPKDMSEEIWGDLDHFILDPDEARKMRGREPLEIEGELEIDVGAQVEEVGAALNLNGVQITAATKIVGMVSAGEIPRDSGKNQLMIFFNLDEGQAEALLGAAGTGKKVKPDKTVPPVEKTIAKLQKYIEKLEDELINSEEL